MVAMEQFLSAITSVVSLPLYDAGIKSISNLKGAVLTSDPVPWPSIFSGIEVIVNRQTPDHRDSGGSSAMYDLLVSLGNAYQAMFHLSDLGAELTYCPGTLVYNLGKVLEHGVHWEKDERIVIAHWFKDNVHDKLGVERPRIPSQFHFLDQIGTR